MLNLLISTYLPFNIAPITNPIGIFLLVAIIILLVPLLNKIRIPHIIGLIIAGVIIGPHSLNLLQDSSSIEILSSVGILYIMFQAGIEIDLQSFSKYKKQGIFFGTLTFLVPVVLGLLSCRYILQMSWLTSALISTIYACHTLVAYPLINKMGIRHNRAVSIAIAGTIITIAVSLVALAAVVNVHNGDAQNYWTWVRLIVGTLLLGLVMMFVILPISRIYLRKITDSTGQYIFVLAIIFICSLLAKVAGLEAILGAFMAGLILNRLVPNISPLMNRIEFVGNALFIPFFLIGIGMSINVHAFISTYQTVVIALVMSIIALSSKWIAAWITQKTTGLNRHERKLLFGLSSGKAAATLAAGMIGYQYGLIDDNVLNASVVLILVTCTASSIATEQAARKIALLQKNTSSESNVKSERILIPISNPQTMPFLIDLGNAIKRHKNKEALCALKITAEQPTAADMQMLEQAAFLASATDNHLETISKIDFNITNCISTTAKEKNITDIIVGLHKKSNIIDSILGSIITNLVSHAGEQTLLIYRPINELNTIKSIKVIVPDMAQSEVGFNMWVERIKNCALALAVPLVIYASNETKSAINKILAPYTSLNVEYQENGSYSAIAAQSDDSDLIFIISARPQTISYKMEMSSIPQNINRYFANNSFVLVYPQQNQVTNTKFNPLNVDFS